MMPVQTRGYLLRPSRNGTRELIMSLSFYWNLLPPIQLSLIRVAKGYSGNNLIPRRSSEFYQLVRIWEIELSAIRIVDGYALEVPRSGNTHRRARQRSLALLLHRSWNRYDWLDLLGWNDQLIHLGFVGFLALNGTVGFIVLDFHGKYDPISR